MFDTVAGLPVHVLLVHLVVVGVPLMSLLTVAAAARPSWRTRAAWVVVLLNAGLFVVTLATRRAGESLAERVGAAQVVEHSDLGEKMPWFVLGLLVVSLLVPVLRHRRPMATLVLVLAVLVAAANVYWVIRVGDSGSRAVWEDIVRNTRPPS